MRYLNRLETQLVAASRELSGAPAGPAYRARTRLPIFVRRHAYLSAALALVTVAGASGAIADASGLFQGPDLSAPSPLGTASSIPSDMASSFAIFRRARAPQIDALPAYPPPGLDVSGGLGRHYGVNLNLSRFVGSVDGTSVWLVPGSTGTCMYTARDGGSCAANDLVATQGTVIALVPVAGGPDAFIGVVPDDASVTATNTDGTQGTVTRSGGAYSVTGDANLRSITIHEAAGHTLTLPAPGPAPTASPTTTSQTTSSTGAAS